MMHLLTQDDSYIRMNPDGTFENGRYIIELESIDGDESEYCTFETDSAGHLRRISYNGTWDGVKYLKYSSGRSEEYAIAALASQSGITYQKLIAFATALNEKAEKENAALRFDNVEIEWNVDGQGYRTENGYCIALDQTQPARVSIQFTITIYDT